MSLLYVLLFCGLVGVVVGQKCQTCMNNGAYCVDKSNYYICPDGKNPETSMELECDPLYECTDHADICVLSTELTPKNATSVCDVSDACGACPNGQRFACISRTQYALCSDKTKTASCPEGEVCRIGTYDTKKVICVPECVMNFYGYSATCASSTPAPTTTVAPPATTTLSPTRLNDICKEKKPTPTPTYFYVPNCTDSTCKSYIYCEKTGTDDFETVALTCKSGFYDKSSNTCVTTKPNNCDTSCA